MNEISHWSKSFRLALAYEIEKSIERYSVIWRKWAEDRHLLLKKTYKWAKEPENWREVPIRRIILAYLLGEHTWELAALRGGEANNIMEHIQRRLAQRGMPALSLTIHHQAAVAEIMLAMESHYRRPYAGRE